MGAKVADVMAQGGIAGSGLLTILPAVRVDHGGAMVATSSIAGGVCRWEGHSH